MPHLTLSYDDATVLRQLLEAARLELAREIAHTDSRDFRQALQERDRTLERLLEDLKQEELSGEQM